ncbi:tail fiber protein [Escherichia phage C119]|uniref:Tail fiber protein n=1 Tax=Escherichia phage C119 TaxID=1735565 RepID=A0A0P0J030_9CAUD|nr:tail fiber protein [Escherichia phage C119]ALJ98909.1 tail fiber protein [Escherichia phage C119]
MAIYDAGTASLAADGTVTGVGTTWRQPLTLIRVGATMIFNTTPTSIVTIAEILSDTEIRVFNDKGFTAPAGTQYSILAHDGITVQGLAQDVAETLRYYQSRETEVAAAVDAFNQFDSDSFQQSVNNVNMQSQQVAVDAAQVSSDKDQVSSDRQLAESSANSASSSATIASSAAASVSSALVVDFSNGGEINSRTQPAIYFNDNHVSVYYWSGSVPKSIPQNSSPQSTGGIGVGFWIQQDYTRRFESVSAMTNSARIYDLEVVYCDSYIGGLGYGGGFFVCKPESSLSYGLSSGLVFESSTGYYWERICSGELSPCELGAIKSSTSDSTTQIQQILDSGLALKLDSDYMASNLVMRNKSCSIIGFGKHKSRITQLSSSIGSLIEVSDSCSLIHIEGIALYGTGAQQDTAFTDGTAGIYIPTPTGLSTNYPFNTGADPRRDLTIRNTHIAGFDVYGIFVAAGNYSPVLDDVLIQHIKKDGLINETTDFTWNNIKVNTCGRNCLILRNAGNCRIVGGKFIWSGWSAYNELDDAYGILIDNCQNITMSAIEAQDCGGDGVRIVNSRNVVFNGLNSNRNSINSNYRDYNVSFSNSSVRIYGFVGLNYVSNNGDGRPTSAGNFRFLDSRSDVVIDGVVESGYFGPNFSGDTNYVAEYSGNLKINGLIDKRKTRIKPANDTSAFDGVSNTPVFAAAASSVGQQYWLRLSQANKDKIICTGFDPSLGFTATCNISPTITVAEDFNLIAIGTGFGVNSNALYLQYNVMASGEHSVSLLISASGETRVLSGVLPVSSRMVNGGTYNIALGFDVSGKVWWSILNLNTGFRVRRSFDSQYIDIDVRPILTTAGNYVTMYSGQGAGDVACSGYGFGVYVGSYSDESDYCASRYYSLKGGVDLTKQSVFLSLNGDVTSQ